MKHITKEKWLEALLAINQGSRLNQLLSVMSGGAIQYIAWQDTAAFASSDAAEQRGILQQMLAQAQLEICWPAQPEQWQGAGILHDKDGKRGLLVVAAFAVMEDFQQAQLQQKLSWLRQLQRQNKFPVRLLLLAFSKVPDDAQEQPGMLEAWQWEEILETGVQMAIGQQAVLEEVMLLPMIAYRRWLEIEA